MGVPTFYRWLCCRYPRVVIDVGDDHVQQMREEIRLKKEEKRMRQESCQKQQQNSSVHTPQGGQGDGKNAGEKNEKGESFSKNDATETTQQGGEKKERKEQDEDEEEEEFGYDCLYLDMNGIIHPCCHTDDGSCPSSEEEMFLSIFQYVDRIVDIIQPRQLLYMAIDGVAPRAKMNQQRTRRFKAAKDIQEEEKAYEEIKTQFLSEGREVPPKKLRWDSNVITPGTPFMHRLAKALTYYIQDRLASRPTWKHLTVIFSDATVPGEGEHKIMDYIRQQRKSPEHSANLRHVLHGADADLIMLGLSTHEANFFVLREAVVDRTPERVCSACNAVGHTAEHCPTGKGGGGGGEQQGQSQEGGGEEESPMMKMLLEQDRRGLKRHLEEQGVELPEEWALGLENHRRGWKPLQMLQLPVLREYLKYEFITSQDGEGLFDLERCIDDFVFLCFLCGNDFLPHLPHQSIQRGSIDALVQLYVHLRPKVVTDYLTQEGKVNLKQLQVFLHHLAMVEKETIRRDLQRKSRMREKNEQEKQMKLLEKAKAIAQDIQRRDVSSSSSCTNRAPAGGDLSNANTLKEEEKNKKDRNFQETSERKIGEKGANGEVLELTSNEAAARLLKQEIEKKILSQDDKGGVKKEEQENLKKKTEEISDREKPFSSSSPVKGTAVTSHEAKEEEKKSNQEEEEKDSSSSMKNELFQENEGTKEEEEKSLTCVDTIDPEGGLPPRKRRRGDKMNCEEGKQDVSSSSSMVSIPVTGEEEEGKREREIVGASSTGPSSSSGSPPLDNRDFIEKKLKRKKMGEEGEEDSSEGNQAGSIKTKREEDFDAFKMKLSEKLHKELDNHALLYDEVDGGVGCADRNVWRRKYYMQKFHLPNRPTLSLSEPQQAQPQHQEGREEEERKKKLLDEDIEALSRDVALAYIVGLQWVLYYYFQGCKSFNWFYPFHYAPLAVDLADELKRKLGGGAGEINSNRASYGREATNSSSSSASSSATPSIQDNRQIDREGTVKQLQPFEITFELGTPFRAFEQLMSVLPPYSASCMPPAHAALMTNPVSPISDFYPTDVRMDPNGKRFQWQWVVLLPFIDEERLLKNCKTLEKLLTEEERERNRRGCDRLFVHKTHPLACNLKDVIENSQYGRGVFSHEDVDDLSLKNEDAYSGVRGEGRLLSVFSLESTSSRNLRDTDEETEESEVGEKERKEEEPKEAGVGSKKKKKRGMTGKLYRNQYSVQAGEYVASPIECLPDIVSMSYCCFYTTLRLPLSHRSILLEGVKPYVPVLDRFDLEDEERRDRAFSGAVARRIVMTTLNLRHHPGGGGREGGGGEGFHPPPPHHSNRGGGNGGGPYPSYAFSLYSHPNRGDFQGGGPRPPHYPNYHSQNPHPFPPYQQGDRSSHHDSYSQMSRHSSSYGGGGRGGGYRGGGRGSSSGCSMPRMHAPPPPYPPVANAACYYPPHNPRGGGPAGGGGGPHRGGYAMGYPSSSYYSNPPPPPAAAAVAGSASVLSQYGHQDQHASSYHQNSTYYGGQPQQAAARITSYSSSSSSNASSYYQPSPQPMYGGGYDGQPQRYQAPQAGAGGRGPHDASQGGGGYYGGSYPSSAAPGLPPASSSSLHTGAGGSSASHMVPGDPWAQQLYAGGGGSSGGYMTGGGQYNAYSKTSYYTTTAGGGGGYGYDGRAGGGEDRAAAEGSGRYSEIHFRGGGR